MDSRNKSRLGQEAAEALRQDDALTRSDGTTARRPRKPAGDSLFRMPVKVRDGLLEKLRGAPLSVYLALLSHANKQRLAWPSAATLCDETGYAKTAVYSALAKLLKLGLIEPTLRLTSRGLVKAWRVPKRANAFENAEDAQSSAPAESLSALSENLSAPADHKTTKEDGNRLLAAQDNHFGEDDAPGEKNAPSAHLHHSDFERASERNGEPVEVASEIIEGWDDWQGQPPGEGALQALSKYSERLPIKEIVSQIQALAADGEGDTRALWLALGRFEWEARDAG